MAFLPNTGRESSDRSPVQVGAPGERVATPTSRGLLLVSHEPTGQAWCRGGFSASSRRSCPGRLDGRRGCDTAGHSRPFSRGESSQAVTGGGGLSVGLQLVGRGAESTGRTEEGRGVGDGGGRGCAEAVQGEKTRRPRAPTALSSGLISSPGLVALLAFMFQEGSFYSCSKFLIFPLLS